MLLGCFCVFVFQDPLVIEGGEMGAGSGGRTEGAQSGWNRR